jgi:hypothetical protein
MASLLETKGNLMHVRYSSNLIKQWVDTSRVAFVVEGRGSRRRSASRTTTPEEVKADEGRVQRSATRVVPSKVDSTDQGEEDDDEQEFDWFPGKSADQDDDEEEVKHHKLGKSKNNKKSSQSIDAADEEGAASLPGERIHRTKKQKMKGKRKNEIVFLEDEISTEEGMAPNKPTTKRPRTGKTPPGYRNPTRSEAVGHEKPDGMKVPARLVPSTMPPTKAQANTKHHPTGHANVLSGTTVAKVSFLSVRSFLYFV